MLYNFFVFAGIGEGTLHSQVDDRANGRDFFIAPFIVIADCINYQNYQNINK